MFLRMSTCDFRHPSHSNSCHDQWWCRASKWPLNALRLFSHVRRRRISLFFSLSLSLSRFSNFQSWSWIVEGARSCVPVSHARERFAFTLLYGAPSASACVRRRKRVRANDWYTYIRACVSLNETGERYERNNIRRKRERERAGKRARIAGQGRWFTMRPVCVF